LNPGNYHLPVTQYTAIWQGLPYGFSDASSIPDL